MAAASRENAYGCRAQKPAPELTKFCCAAHTPSVQRRPACVVCMQAQRHTGICMAQTQRMAAPLPWHKEQIDHARINGIRCPLHGKLLVRTGSCMGGAGSSTWIR